MRADIRRVYGDRSHAGSRCGATTMWLCTLCLKPFFHCETDEIGKVIGIASDSPGRAIPVWLARNLFAVPGI
jgi:Zn-finger protein